jgi:hypothetical protein
MSEPTADLPDLSGCYSLFFAPGIDEFQPLGPVLFSPARATRGRFATGSSGNPRGRPRGIPNPKRRVPDLVARPLSAEALSNLFHRKPHLRRALFAQILPPRAAIDPAERLGIDLSAVRTTADVRRVLVTTWAAIGRGEIAPAEGGRIARRVRTRWRALRRLARSERRLAAVRARENPARG